MIYGPDGRPLAEPLPETEEGLVYADIDLGMISLAKAAADPVGHYSRPGVLQLVFDPRPKSRVIEAAETLPTDGTRTELAPATLPEESGTDDATA